MQTILHLLQDRLVAEAVYVGMEDYRYGPMWATVF